MTRIVINDRGQWLIGPAAESILRAIRDGCPNVFTSMGRDWNEQMALYTKWLRGHGNFALHPDKSWHCKGKAVDAPGDTRDWLVENGKRYGWRRTNPSEPWHFDYFEAEDTHPEPRKRKRIPTMIIIQNGSRYRLVSGDLIVGIDPDDVPAFNRAGVPTVPVSVKTWDQLRAGLIPGA